MNLESNCTTVSIQYPYQQKKKCRCNAIRKKLFQNLHCLSTFWVACLIVKDYFVWLLFVPFTLAGSCLFGIYPACHDQLAVDSMNCVIFALIQLGIERWWGNKNTILIVCHTNLWSLFILGVRIWYVLCTSRCRTFEAWWWWRWKAWVLIICQW